MRGRGVGVGIGFKVRERRMDKEGEMVVVGDMELER